MCSGSRGRDAAGTSREGAAANSRKYKEPPALAAPLGGENSAGTILCPVPQLFSALPSPRGSVREKAPRQTGFGQGRRFKARVAAGTRDCQSSHRCSPRDRTSHYWTGFRECQAVACQPLIRSLPHKNSVTEKHQDGCILCRLVMRAAVSTTRSASPVRNRLSAAPKFLGLGARRHTSLH